ncbi:hypothetical protein DSM106972_094990 [Dulcicalothrix desertica PCC 7102]|uniref:HEAT repeat domain-containing protein n=1 Tax=Dulcicalothrix desertica PCC 7102 TaxID=232991 RepID=A0A433UJF5_9CYAN|nr:hypothetical protein [Dulcicalothrix desertica]RUS93962.1 hypothetical protein DSM106972_094990 [Dulcicalothrix desertica PCC 7102]TWH62625.1 hypothetical protein CAL7102_00122 [Dulcicalothrix desertica PCC 7102]
MNPTLAGQIFESFLHPGERAIATHKLSSFGVNAIPVLESLFSGEAKNSWGVSYSRLGMPIYCGLITAKLLGSLAKPLEPFIRECLHSAEGGMYAVEALRAIGTLDETSIVELAACLNKNTSLAWEVAYTLHCCGAEKNEAVIEIANSSQKISRILIDARKSYYKNLLNS